MTQSFRQAEGGRIDRTRPLNFTFDGKTYTGFAGDTLASALLANGVHLVGRSFKYHRPRGIMGIASDEPNALVSVRRDERRYTPNLPATMVELYDGLTAESQNRFPSLAYDSMAVNDALLSRFIPAGFYYKTFMWPRRAWEKLYEPFIRQAAGLGKPPQHPDPDIYAQRYAHCDVLIVGSGPAGIAAALAAAQSGARVVLCENQAEMGGSLLAAQSVIIDGKPSAEWLSQMLTMLAAMPNVTLLTRTNAFGYYPHNLVALCERLTDHQSNPGPGRLRERLWQVRARQVVIAAGAIERPLVFPGNDRPGIMLANAARTYLQQFGVAVGRRIVIATAHDSGYRTARELRDAGVKIAAILDLRENAPRTEEAGSNKFRILTGAHILGTKGRLRVSSILVDSLGKQETIACDAVLMAGGFTPSVHLFSQSRGKLKWDETLNAYVPEISAEAERSVGACRGLLSLSEALCDGHEGGMAAADAAGFTSQTTSEGPHADIAGGYQLGGAGHAPLAAQEGGKQKAFVDWQNDVTVNDIRLAAQEGFVSVEHAKRYTTTGMATDQGKLSNINALGILADTTGRTIPEVGHTTFRPPFTPITFGTLAGRARGELFDPARITSIHDWAVEHGAVFENVSNWKRAFYFPREHETMREAVARECLQVRRSVGIFDASTLGKIEVVGPDAAEFMNRIYTNAWKQLKVGRLRYGVMLREDGFVYDDGVVGRIAPDRFHVTTTTGGAARVLNMMEDYLQTEWPDLDVWLTSTTEQWSVIAVQGPHSRDVLAPLVEGIDISADAFPHMSVADGRICGVPCRLMRVSFTGELGFEVNVPSGAGREVWEEIWERGQKFDMVPYGTETMHVLRAEKGYILVGQDTDGTASPDDVGLGWAIGKKKPDFVGKRSLSRPAFIRPGRKQLVGLVTADPAIVLEEGAQVVEPHAERNALGHVTSAYHSAVLGKSIALCMIADGRNRMGQTLTAPMPDGPVEVKVVEPVFFDPEGTRVNA